MSPTIFCVVLLSAFYCGVGESAQASAPLSDFTKTIHVRDNHLYDGKALTVPMGADASVEMYQRWMEQAYSGLFTAVALKKLPSLSTEARTELADCSRRSYDVIQHANCLKNIMTHERQQAKPTKPEIMEPKPSFIVVPVKDNNNNIAQRSRSMRLIKYMRAAKPQTRRERNFVYLRRKRALSNTANDAESNAVSIIKTTQRTEYTLMDRNAGLGPLGSVAKILTASLLSSKNKTRIENWDTTIRKIQRIVEKRKHDKKKREERKLRAANVLNDSSSYSNYVPFQGLKEKELDELDNSMHDTKQLSNFLTAAKRQQQMKNSDAALRISDLVREGVRVGFSLAGQNTTEFDRKTLKLASPRFLSVVPEDVDENNSTLNLLSPSLFSMHDEGRGLEKAASMASLSRDFSAADRSAWLNLVMEAAGVGEQADRLEQEENNSTNSSTAPSILSELLQKTRETFKNDSRGEDGQPLYFTKENVTERYGDVERRKIETFERLMRSYSPNQLIELNTTGYVLLTSDQLRLVYGPQSPYNDSETLDRLLPLDNATVHGAIEQDIVRIAQMKSFQVRQKDIALSPIILSPLVGAWPTLNQFIVLSPLVLSPIVLSPAVLGPAVLSPFVFVPIILSPRVLAPLILDPLLFVPVVLSPLVLHPFILTPGVFVPFILTPFVFSPLILSPQVFTPLILSPLVLSPLILNPMVGSPLVLSPFVLSPLILSPQALFAVVLSPYALSPLVESKLIASSLVLSPSWLS